MAVQELPQKPAANEVPGPSAGMMQAFAHALEQWTLSVDDPTCIESHLPLLAKYESICDREIASLEAQMQQPSNSSMLAAALASESALLRGERSSWRLLRLLYADFAARQQPPPELPPPPSDWGGELRALGGPLPRLGAEEIAARAADMEAGTGLSREPANAGLSVRPLHDEAVLEARFLASDVLLDLGTRLKGWLEHAAAERVRVRELDATMRHTRIRLEVRMRATRCRMRTIITPRAFLLSHLSCSHLTLTHVTHLIGFGFSHLFSRVRAVCLGCEGRVHHPAARRDAQRRGVAPRRIQAQALARRLRRRARRRHHRCSRRER